MFAANHVNGRRVLDAGCGTGYGALLLAQAGAASVVGVDVAPDTVLYAQQKFGAPNIEFQQDDCERLTSVTGRFDVICNFENIEHLRHPHRFLARAGQLLNDQGILLVSSPDRRDTPPFVNGCPRNPFHFHEWYQDEFHRLLADHFEEIDLRVQVRSVSLQSRSAGVEALRQGLMWSNPVLLWLWRKFWLTKRRVRAWKALEGLAAPTIADFPIVPSATSSIFGAPCFHLAICRCPKIERAQPRGPMAA
jgi:SAM-dependent methyltransferase